MKLVILGATGGTGRQLVRRALARGHAVTAVVRNPARLPISDPALYVRIADVTDPDALEPVFTGHDAVLSALGPHDNKQAGIVANATKAILRALGSGEVRRLVTISAVPVGPISPYEPLLARVVISPLVRRIFRDVYADLAEMERQLEAASGIDWTILRPPRLLDRPGKGQYRTQIGGAVPRGFSISRADLAHAMLASLADPTTIRQIVGVAY
jgi:putative NADH-flavin reductase